MKRTALFSLGSALVAFTAITIAGYGCGDDDDNTAKPRPDTGVSTPETGGGDTGIDAGGKPPIPTLGAQIERMGRPAVSTALISTFDDSAAAKGAAKDDYNKDNAQAGWAAKYNAEMSNNLAVYDGLDVTAVPGDGCGNQLLANPDGGTNATRYGALAGVLADDRLWLNTAGNTAGQYLAVEANAVGVVNTDRGGRTLAYDVVDVTYSAVSVGNITASPAPVGDKIAADPAKTGGTTFPYLAAP